MGDEPVVRCRTRLPSDMNSLCKDPTMTTAEGRPPELPRHIAGQCCTFDIALMETHRDPGLGDMGCVERGGMLGQDQAATQCNPCAC